MAIIGAMDDGEEQFRHSRGLQQSKRGGAPGERKRRRTSREAPCVDTQPARRELVPRPPARSSKPHEVQPRQAARQAAPPRVPKPPTSVKELNRPRVSRPAAGGGVGASAPPAEAPRDRAHRGRARPAQPEYGSPIFAPPAHSTHSSSLSSTSDNSDMSCASGRQRQYSLGNCALPPSPARDASECV